MELGGPHDIKTGYRLFVNKWILNWSLILYTRTLIFS